MLASLRPLLSHERTAGQWISPLLLPGVAYLIAGALWTATHTERFTRLGGLDVVVSALGSIVAWPVLLLFSVCP